MSDLKLYVWHDALTDHTPGVMFALAGSVDEARAKVLSGCCYVPDDDIQKEPKVYDAPVGFAVWGGG
jgi:hypothetical protein